jgi:hypothetical protein
VTAASPPPVEPSDDVWVWDLASLGELRDAAKRRVDELLAQLVEARATLARTEKMITVVRTGGTVITRLVPNAPDVEVVPPTRSRSSRER